VKSQLILNEWGSGGLTLIWSHRSGGVAQ
jgi:hypothetical protein